MAEAYPTLLQGEREAREATRRDFPEEIDLVTRLINAYLRAFNEMGSYTAAQDLDPRLLILALVSRSFNSVRCSFDLLLRAYYQQSVALTRMKVWRQRLEAGAAGQEPTADSAPPADRNTSALPEFVEAIG